MSGTVFNRCAAALAMIAFALCLAIPPAAESKSMYELRIGGAISLQGEISPTLFAGRPCVAVVPRIRGDGSERTHSGAGFIEIEADRRYWMLVTFNARQRPAEAAPPALLVQNPETSRSVRTEADAVFSGQDGAYTTLELRFPDPGSWTVSIVDGFQRFEFSTGRIFATGSGPAAPTTTPAELAEMLGPTPALDPAACVAQPSPATAAGRSGSGGLPIAIGGAIVAGVGGLALFVRRRSRSHP